MNTSDIKVNGTEYAYGWDELGSDSLYRCIVEAIGVDRLVQGPQGYDWANDGVRIRTVSDSGVYGSAHIVAAGDLKGRWSDHKATQRRRTEASVRANEAGSTGSNVVSGWDRFWDIIPALMWIAVIALVGLLPTIFNWIGEHAPLLPGLVIAAIIWWGYFRWKIRSSGSPQGTSFSQDRKEYAVGRHLDGLERRAADRMGMQRRMDNFNRNFR